MCHVRVREHHWRRLTPNSDENCRSNFGEQRLKDGGAASGQAILTGVKERVEAQCLEMRSALL
eukprot:scaffold15099_cov37-Tisochrysis_lutea.AAC.5